MHLIGRKNLPIDEIQLRGTYTGSKRNMEVTTPFDTTLGGAFVEIGNDREDMFYQRCRRKCKIKHLFAIVVTMVYLIH